MATVRIRKRLDNDEMNKGIGLLQAGLSQRDIARRLDGSQSVLGRMRHCCQSHGNVLCRQEGSCTRSTTLSQDRYIVVQTHRNCFQNAFILRNEFQNASGVRVSNQTIRSHLHDERTSARTLAIGIPLQQHHV